MRPALIIANRGAGTFCRQHLDDACRRLATAGIETELSVCDDFAELTARAASACRQPEAPLIIAAGGDGTINAVFNGLTGGNAACAILPLGTANVMALELGLASPAAAVSRILANRQRPLTAGLLQSGQRSSRFFLMAGSGLDGRVVRAVSLKEKRLLGKGAYLLAALRCFRAWESGRLTVTTDRERFTCSTLIVCNAARYGGSFALAPAASLFSPDFELVAIRDNGRHHSLLALAAAAAGSGRSGQLFRTRATTITIDGDKPVQADGDDWGDCPVTIRAEPDFARLLC